MSQISKSLGLNGEVHEMTVMTPSSMPSVSQLPIATNYDNYDNRESHCSSFIGTMMIFCVFLVICVTFPVSLLFCLAVVQEHERAVVFRNGHLLGPQGPGVVFVLPYVDTYCIVDLRTVCYDVTPQKILTKDSITVDVEAVVLYHVRNAIVAITNVENYDRATRLLTASTLRNVLGTKTLSEILANTKPIAESMKTILDEATDFWGIRVERVEIKNVRLPLQLQKAMAAEAQATREARAKLIEANGEQKASRELSEAAKVLDKSPMAMQLRYLQVLSGISAKDNRTIIFPFPNELFRACIDIDNS